MAEVARFETVSKRFILHHEKSKSFQDVLVNLFRTTGEVEEFWALQDVSFSIKAGESVALVGQNGSGKSTALKLVSQILRPTSGKVSVYGRVSALLELGAGFHPDLTGKENVYLNGSILGLTRREIDARFDEIVDFSELERFIDTPVKHFSSGMYMRLGFAVAVMTVPDILVIDEVLAVGDDSFRKKCLGKINQLRDEGATILLVSHAAPVIQQICDRAILLDDGELIMDGETKPVLEYYEGLLNSHEGHRLRERPGQGKVQRVLIQPGPGALPEEVAAPEAVVEADPDPEPEAPTATGEVRISRAAMRDSNGYERSIFSTGEAMSVELSFRCDGLAEPANIISYIIATGGALCHCAGTKAQGLRLDWLPAEGAVQVRYPSLALGPGTYYFGVQITRCSPNLPLYFDNQQMVSFEITSDNYFSTGLVSMANQWIIDGLSQFTSDDGEFSLGGREIETAGR
jgi:ABC-type polysaccharide/polyol phosphate transport system ATPase subunit